jgi:hypothetical protein
MWSDCAVEAVKAVWRNPYNRVYLVLNFNWGLPEVHVYWFDFERMRYYHFFAKNQLSYLAKLWHKGVIRKYNKHRYNNSWRIW